MSLLKNCIKSKNIEPIIESILGVCLINRKFMCVFLLIVYLCFCIIPCHQSINISAQTDNVSIKIQEANTALNGAFNAVLDAEQAGANITDLITQLIFAANNLSQVENNYRIGDYTAAVSQAESVVISAQEVVEAAQNAKEDAIISVKNAFWSKIVFTVIGSVVFILLLFLVWRQLKKHYINNLFQAKPEVCNQ